MGFRQSLTYLLSNVNGCPHTHLFCHPDQTFQILTGHKLHRDEVSALFFIEVIHAADIFMDDLASEFQFIGKAFDYIFIRGNFCLYELESHFFFDLLVFYSVDNTHPPLSQFFDHFIPARENSPSDYLI
ncbi:hypothetical protein ES703_62409 [subsurface metagenome]